MGKRNAESSQLDLRKSISIFFATAVEGCVKPSRMRDVIIATGSYIGPTASAWDAEIRFGGDRSIHLSYVPG